MRGDSNVELPSASPLHFTRAKPTEEMAVARKELASAAYMW